MAVAIVINECTAGAPLLPISGNAGGLGGFFERAVALVVIKTILAIVGDVQIVEAIVVVVARADALSPAGGAQAGFVGHVGEGAVVIVVKEMIGGSRRSGLRTERGAVHDEDVGPTIVVVVEDGDAAAGGLDDVLLGVLVTGNDFELQAGFFGEVLEISYGRLRGRRLRERGEEADSTHYNQENQDSTTGRHLWAFYPRMPTQNSWDGQIAIFLRVQIKLGHTSLVQLFPIRALLSRILVCLILVWVANLSFAQSDPTKSASAYQHGMQAWQSGDLSAAQVAFDAAVKANPADADAQNALAQVLLELGKIDEAIGHLRMVTRLRPNLAVAHVYLGNALVQKGSQQEALAELRTAIKLAPQQPQAHEALARALSENRTSDAIAEMKIAVRLAPGSVEIHDELGSLLAQNQQFKLAEDEFQAALRINPKYEPALLHLGVAYLNDEKRAEATTLLRQATQIAPDDGLAHYYLGTIREAEQEQQAALDEYRDAAKVLPNYLPLRTRLGLLAQRVGDMPTAIESFRIVAAAEPENPSAHNDLGLALAQSAQAEEAIKEFEAAIAIAPKDSSYRNNLGAVYLQKSDFDSAIEQYKQGIAITPNNAELHYNLGLAYKLKDDLANSITELQKSVELDSQLPDPHYTLGIIYWQTGKFDDAITQLREVIRLKPDYAEAYYTLGTVYKQAGKLAESAQALHQALRLQPDFAGAHTTLAAVLRQQGDTAGAETEAKLGAAMVRQKMTRQAAVFDTNSGMRLMHVGDVDGAISQFEVGIKADSSYAPAHQQLAAALARKGEKTRSEQELEIARKLVDRNKQ